MYLNIFIRRFNLLIYLSLKYLTVLSAQGEDANKNIYPGFADQVGMLVTIEKKVGSVNCGCEFGKNSKDQRIIYKLHIDSILFIQDLANTQSVLALCRERPYFLFESEIDTALKASKFVVFAEVSYYEYFLVNRFFDLEKYEKHHSEHIRMDVLTGVRACLKPTPWQRLIAPFIWRKKKRAVFLKKVKDLPKEEQETWKFIQQDLKTRGF